MQEDPSHAEDTLKWLLRLSPRADEALQIAALAHDIERAVEEGRVYRADYDDYDIFKADHARNGAKILRKILNKCGVSISITNEDAATSYRLFTIQNKIYSKKIML